MYCHCCVFDIPVMSVLMLWKIPGLRFIWFNNTSMLTAADILICLTTLIWWHLSNCCASVGYLHTTSALIWCLVGITYANSNNLRECCYMRPLRLLDPTVYIYTDIHSHLQWLNAVLLMLLWFILNSTDNYRSSIVILTSSINTRGFSVLVFFRHWIIFPGMAPTYVLLNIHKHILENLEFQMMQSLLMQSPGCRLPLSFLCWSLFFPQELRERN